MQILLLLDSQVSCYSPFTVFMLSYILPYLDMRNWLHPSFSFTLHSKSVQNIIKYMTEDATWTIVSEASVWKERTRDMKKILPGALSSWSQRKNKNQNNTDTPGINKALTLQVKWYVGLFLSHRLIHNPTLRS